MELKAEHATAGMLPVAAEGDSVPGEAVVPARSLVRRQIGVTGGGRGAGFEQSVSRLAAVHGLGGWVVSAGAGSVVEIEGPAAAAEAFVAELPTAVSSPDGIGPLRVREFATLMGHDGFAAMALPGGEEHGPGPDPACEPVVAVVDRDGAVIAGPDRWRAFCADLLHSGGVLAVKGPGGFQLTCDALNPEAVARLREKMRRQHRPFAVICRDLHVVRRLCRVTPEERRLLESPAAPIVLLERREGTPLAGAVAPGLRQLGVMLPAGAVHLALLQSGPDCLVVTGGHPGGQLLYTEAAEARAGLGDVADAFLTQNTPIEAPCADSVVQVVDGQPVFVRRSRGYAATPVEVAGAVGQPVVLGVGGDRENAFCLLEGERAVLSQHLGDLEAEAAKGHFRRALRTVQRITGTRPAVVAHDLHPRYQSGLLAEELRLPCVRVQHHHAHMAACMAENGLTGPVIGLVLDAGGYGTDGAMWGFEVLAGDYLDAARIAHLAYSPVPGGEAAFRQPLMAATGMVWAHLGEAGVARLAAVRRDRAVEVAAAAALLRTGAPLPRAGTAGRLFESVAAILGICLRQTYEGQAAAELGAVAVSEMLPEYRVSLSGETFQVGPLFEAIMADLERGMLPSVVAGRFLATVVSMLSVGARKARQATGLSQVCLSGDAFLSPWLLRRAVARLQGDGFQVHRHRAVSPGDGGIALGQAMIARRRWQDT